MRRESSSSQARPTGKLEHACRIVGLAGGIKLGQALLRATLAGDCQTLAQGKLEFGSPGKSISNASRSDLSASPTEQSGSAARFLQRCARRSSRLARAAALLAARPTRRDSLQQLDRPIRARAASWRAPRVTFEHARRSRIAHQREAARGSPSREPERQDEPGRT